MDDSAGQAAFPDFVSLVVLAAFAILLGWAVVRGFQAAFDRSRSRRARMEKGSLSLIGVGFLLVIGVGVVVRQLPFWVLVAFLVTFVLGIAGSNLSALLFQTAPTSKMSWYQEIWDLQRARTRRLSGILRRAGRIMLVPTDAVESGSWYGPAIARGMLLFIVFVGSGAGFFVSMLAAGTPYRDAMMQVTLNWGVVWIVAATIPTFGAWLIVSCATGRPALRASMRRVAEPSAYGAAVGLLVGILMFVGVTLFRGFPNIDAASISLETIFGTAAVGTSIGFVLGGFSALLGAANQAKSPLLGWVGALASLAAIAVLCGFVMSPRKIAERLIISLTSNLPSVPSDPALMDQAAQSDWRVMLVVAPESFIGPLPDGRLFVVVLVLAASMFFLGSITARVRSRWYDDDETLPDDGTAQSDSVAASAREGS